MIDLRQIRSFRDGQRAAFEELVCQLVRRETVPSGSTFRRVDGAGGDGGVEAYWLLPDDSEIGFQAKFFLRTGDIDWNQVDKSVEQAIKVRPNLRQYHVAFACNLTDRSGTKGRGGTGWERWDSRVQKWRREHLDPTGRQVDFFVWDASKLSDRLTRPGAEGLRRYWFGGVEFTQDWFARHVEAAIRTLDERFHPEDHVDVGMQELFRYLVRDAKVVSELRAALDAVLNAPQPDARFAEALSGFPLEALLALDTKRQALRVLTAEFTRPNWESWRRSGWKAKAKELLDAIRSVREWRPQEPRPKDQSDAIARNWEAVRRDLRLCEEACYRFGQAVSNRFLQAEASRFAIITGRAGSGKSHLLGHWAQEAVANGRPVILLLGQHFRDADIWTQIAERLELPGSSAAEILGALDAVAAANATRALILIDAINEGAGSALWRRELAGFVARIEPFTNVACVVTCRSEYQHYAIPGALRTVPRHEIAGFETAEEQLQAARAYMDRRGISRPGTPWLAPEFVNPLFLRSTCEALRRDGKTEFPRGLHGTKEILGLYLRSIGRHLNAGRDGTDELVGPTAAALLNIAGRMAAASFDFVTLRTATQLANEAFSAYPPPPGRSWLDVLLQNGLLRKDPSPVEGAADPLKIPEDIVRFSFQRFQDHLIAESLLASVTDVRAAFDKGGALAFVLDDDRISWRWSGLVEALATQLPERFGVELVDAFPGQPETWWHSYAGQNAFKESVRWRAKHAFKDRTLELLNRFGSSRLEAFRLLIELCAIPEHPWNADFAHKNLLRRKMPDRDAFWTVHLNEVSVDEGTPVGRLIDWCLFGQSPSVDKEAQRLSALTLCWFFTASSRPVRDRATKALTATLLSRAELFQTLCHAFRDVDDPYVKERLFAAAYGACCIDPISERLRSYALQTFEAVFKDKPVPESILLRDYARGIVELAVTRAALPDSIELEKCRPPYGSPVPRLTITESGLSKIAKKAGDERIMRSCLQMGDFGHYEVRPRVHRIFSTRLNRPRPIRREERRRLFESEVVEIDPHRSVLWERLLSVNAEHFSLFVLPSINGEPPSSDEKSAGLRAWTARVKKAKAAFVRLLSPRERERFRKERESEFSFGQRSKKDPTEPERISAENASRWIAARAYDLGWTKKRFPDDRSGDGALSGLRSAIERIGKKYQWIAFDELLCRLADNFWLEDHVSEETRSYDHPLNLFFERDIDPTVLPRADGSNTSALPREPWAFGPPIRLDEAEGADLIEWPFREDPASKLGALVRLKDHEGASWFVLYEDCIANRRSTEPVRDHGTIQQEFRFLMACLVNSEDVASAVAHFKRKGVIDGPRFVPWEQVDEPFLGEASWRSTWPRGRWVTDSSSFATGIRFRPTAFKYQWESHLDASLPRGAIAYVPTPEIADALALVPNPQDWSSWKARDGCQVFVGGKLDDRNASVVVRETALLPYLRQHNLTLLWLMVAERNAYPNGHNGDAAWRRSEGIGWLDQCGQVRMKSWNRDSANGKSAVYLRAKGIELQSGL